MMLRIAAFELRQQLRSHVFWIVAAVSTLMVIGAMTVEELRVGLSDEGSRTGVAAIVRTHLIWSLFYLFTTAAFVADAVLRDDITGFAPIVRTTPLAKRDYLLGRFLGGFAASVICFATVPLGLIIGGYGAGPPVLSAYPFAFFVIAVPNLLFSSALFFGLATAMRSMMGCLLGAVALLMLYGAAPELGGPTALIEPFGFAASAEATAGWTTARRDLEVPALEGTLLVNRLLWLALSAAFLAIAYLGFGRRTRTAPSPAGIEEVAEQPAIAWPLPSPRYGGSLRALQFATRTKLECRQIVLTAPFVVLLLLGGANVGGTLWSAASEGASTEELVRRLIEAFQLVPIVVAIFFAGELFWNEREKGIHPIINAAPVPTFALLLPKFVAMALVLVALAATTAAAAAAIEMTHQGSTDIAAYLLLYLVPKSFDWILFAVLAMALQAGSPNKLAGWGLIVLYLIASLGLEQLGLTHPIYRYGGYPGAPFPEAISGATGADIYRLYWGTVAAGLVVLACRLAARRRRAGG